MDFGTSERHNHGALERTLGPDPEAPGGIDVMRFRERHECLVDVLRSALGLDRRYQAAIWLRETHHAAGRSPRASMRFEHGQEGRQQRSSAQDRAGRAYDDAMRAMGSLASLVASVAVYDRPLERAYRIGLLCQGLDRLADHRGIS